MDRGGGTGIRILIADDDALLRQALAEVLVSRAGFNVVAQCANGREAVDLAETLAPDIALLAHVMPELNGVEAARQLARRAPNTRAIVLGGTLSRSAVVSALRARAAGYIMKHCEIDELILAINIVYRGNPYVAGEIAALFDVNDLIFEARRPESADDGGRLSDREREVAQLLAEGKTARVIAETLCISPRTVDGHRSRIMAKIGAHTRLDLYKWALRAGLAPDPSGGDGRALASGVSG